MQTDRRGEPAPSNARPWHTYAAQEVLRIQEVTESGLSGDEARRRLSSSGPNELKSAPRASAWKAFASQFKNVLVVILLVATMLSAVMGHGLEATVIAAIVLFAVVLSFVQEYRAEQALFALKKMAAPLADVVREGADQRVATRDVVPGDIVVLRTGARVPADCRLIRVTHLTVDESALTGESVSVEKHTNELTDAQLSIGDRSNMAYAATVITTGHGRGVVVATGMETEFGRIAGLVEDVATGRTPLQENLDRLGRTLGRASLAVVAAIALAGLLRGVPLLDVVMFGIALAVAVVPEALPAVVTISLALGVRQMAKRNALVRRLPVVETLGSTSVICSDKTGTLTKNEMTAREVFVAGRTITVTGRGYETDGQFFDGDRTAPLDDGLRELLTAGVLASDARVRQRNGKLEVSGDPTEAALVIAAIKAGLDVDDLYGQLPRTDELPFSSERRRMTTIHELKDGPVAYSKGAAEALLPTCTRWFSERGETGLSDADVKKVQAAELQMAEAGLRVIALARKHGGSVQEAENDMTLLGLVGLMDPPREEAKAAVEVCRQAGIRPVMITGDHPATAAAVARELGILDSGRVVSGRDLGTLDDEGLEREVRNISVYARVSASDKLRIISAWQKRHEVVAMTGDGVNDAPALKKADVGIAMGITGTDVSKEAAAITLLDDNFASIVAAVEEGRIVFDNVRKYLTYLLSSNAGEILLIAAASVLGLPIPVTAVQILYVNLATDGLPALALAVDPAEPGLMKRGPRNARAGIFTRPLVVLLLSGGIWSAAVNLSLFAWLLSANRPLPGAIAMTFISLVLIQLFQAYNYRSDRLSVFNHPFRNRWLNLAVAWELALLAAIVYIPWLQIAFGTFALTGMDWLLVGGAAFTIVPAMEAMKWMRRRGSLGES